MKSIPGLSAIAARRAASAKSGVRPRVWLLVALLFGTATPLSAQIHGASPSTAPTPPPQAANAGFTTVLFNSNFASTTLAAQLSCAGKAQTAPWKQGLWWEGQSNPSSVAPCSQISLVNDPVAKQNVLDLEWTVSGNTDAYDATTVATFPLTTYPYHFAFRHGYVEFVMRAIPNAPGVWPEAWLWSDNSLIESNEPPNWGGGETAEIDVMEGHGQNSANPQGATGAIQLVAALHEYGGNNAYTINPETFDWTQVHTYGLLWTAPTQQWSGGEICSYVDNVLQGCSATTSYTEANDLFLMLSMGVGCNYQNGNRSCLNGLARADLLVSRVTVFGE